MAVHPTEVHLREALGVLDITWSDGHTSRYALAYLRGWCPCARCQGHFAGRMEFQRGVSTELTDIEPVGGYAIRPTWADGHSVGIYPFDYLRRIETAPPDEGPSNQELLAELGVPERPEDDGHET